jgi:hypothetical protein
MPQADPRRGSNINGFSVRATDLALAVETRTFPALLVTEHPDEPAAQKAKQGMVNEVPAPVRG